ncbi:MAG TPA: transcription termination factor NusA [Armatimonadaceae bacterium]|nr:transcription termination factor NusA [Armatimonadaceae bacterium]
MMNTDFFEALRQIEREKDLPNGVLLDAVGKALAKAYQKSLNIENEVNLRIEQGGGKSPLRILRKLSVVDEVANEYAEVTLAEAREKYNPAANVGDVVEELLSERDMDRMSRIAAQTAKQVVVQSIREAERDKIFDEYFEKIGEVITGSVSRREGGNVLIQLGKVEAVLPIKEQVPTESYRFNDRIKVFVVDVKKTNKGPQIVVSRTHPSLIRRLFELEVPEIHDGIVSIKSVAREPGARSKIAVTSKDERVDAVGSCVGHRGARVQAVVNELFDEKIDIVRWSADNRQLITEALSPARVSSVQLNEDTKSAFVVVPDNQLSLAIGKSGQNVRLAARLTGWRIDIRSESQVAKQAFLEAAAQLATSPEDPEAEALLPPITFGDTMEVSKEDAPGE